MNKADMPQFYLGHAGQKQHGRSWHKRGSDPKHAEVDDSYFESYGSFSIHRDMLSDKVGSLTGTPVCYQPLKPAQLPSSLLCVLA